MSSGESKRAGATASPPYSVIEAQRRYVERMLNDVDGMKMLLLDGQTTQMLAMIFSQTEVLQNQVFLTEKLAASRTERMMHLKGVVYVRPTDENLRLLAKELKDPKYSEYHIFFSNILGSDKLRALARADEHEVIASVQEYYADYFAVNHDLLTLNLSDSLLMSLPRERWDRRQQDTFSRCCEGAVAALLSLKWKPVIRYQANSAIAQSFGRELQSRIVQENKLFSFGSGASRGRAQPVVLVLDRRDDPVTPLLTQWTYQAMVKELIGLDDNRVDMSNARNIRKDLKHVVLSCIDDEFFANHMNDNFGDLGAACKDLLAMYQKKYKDNQQIESIEDMQNFVERYPQFKALSNNVSKHVAVVGELSRLVQEHNMMAQSELEQELACSDDHSSQLRILKGLLEDPNLVGIDALRLVLLYALRYEERSGNQISALKRTLQQRKGVSPTQIALIDTILAYGGAAKRGVDLYGNKGLLGSIAKSLKKGVVGIENVYTQHQPYLAQVLDSLLKGKLKDGEYPFAREGSQQKNRPQDVFVFMLGGTTFEEATVVSQLNIAGDVRIVLGGAHVHNSQSFLRELELLSASQSRVGY
eukprot:g4100.t1